MLSPSIHPPIHPPTHGPPVTDTRFALYRTAFRHGDDPDLRGDDDAGCALTAARGTTRPWGLYFGPVAAPQPSALIPCRSWRGHGAEAAEGHPRAAGAPCWPARQPRGPAWARSRPRSAGRGKHPEPSGETNL